jgi:hypothetical protein
MLDARAALIALDVAAIIEGMISAVASSSTGHGSMVG